MSADHTAGAGDRVGMLQKQIDAMLEAMGALDPVLDLMVQKIDILSARQTAAEKSVEASARRDRALLVEIFDKMGQGKHSSPELAALTNLLHILSTEPPRFEPIDDGEVKIVIDTTPTCETGGRKRND